MNQQHLPNGLQINTIENGYITRDPPRYTAATRFRCEDLGINRDQPPPNYQSSQRHYKWLHQNNLQNDPDMNWLYVHECPTQFSARCATCRAIHSPRSQEIPQPMIINGLPEALSRMLLTHRAIKRMQWDPESTWEKAKCDAYLEPVSYTHLTLPTILLV